MLSGILRSRVRQRTLQPLLQQRQPIARHVHTTPIRRSTESNTSEPTPALLPEISPSTVLLLSASVTGAAIAYYEYRLLKAWAKKKYQNMRESGRKWSEKAKAVVGRGGVGDDGEKRESRAEGVQQKKNKVAGAIRERISKIGGNDRN